jgi:hypothetical protein
VIDVRLLRNDPAVVRAALARRGKPDLLEQLEHAISLDARLRDIMLERDALRQREPGEGLEQPQHRLLARVGRLWSGLVHRFVTGFAPIVPQGLTNRHWMGSYPCRE